MFNWGLEQDINADRYKEAQQRIVEKDLEVPSNYKSPQSPEQKGHKPQLETVIADITLAPNKIQDFKIPCQ